MFPDTHSPLAQPTTTRAWWLALYPRLSARTQRALAAACLATALLTQTALSYASSASPRARPASSNVAGAVQRALHDLGLQAPLTSGRPPVGSEFQVNTYITGAQRNSAVGLDSDGDFVIVWQSDSNSGDTLGYSIQAQRYNSIGITQGPQFQVNSYTTGEQRNPQVALDSDGDFVVIWRSSRSGGTDTSGYSVQARRFNSLGTAQGADFQVNTYTTNQQIYPSVALDSNGDFVVVWQSVGSSGTDTLGYSVHGQRYNSLGTAQGLEFQVNTYTTNSQTAPTVGLDSDGDFVIVWQSFGSSGTDTLGNSVHGQRYTSLGTAQGLEFQVNTYTTNNQSTPAVALDSDGDFVVVWGSIGSNGTDTLNTSIQGQRYNSLGAAQATEFQVNTYTTSFQTSPAVALDSDGDFVIAWESQGSGTDTLTKSIQGQRYNNVGTAQDAEFQVNTYTTNNQLDASIALDSTGDFVIVWESNGSSGTDTSGYSIQGQRYTPPVYTVYLPVNFHNAP